MEDNVAKVGQSLNGSPRQLSLLANYLENNSHLNDAMPAKARNHDSMYEPLSSRDDKEIRTLEVFPGAFDEPLRGKLHHCSLRFEYPAYEAKNWQSSTLSFKRNTRHGVSPLDGTAMFYTCLSYTWGMPKFVSPFQCGQQVKLITKSLDSALRHLRHEIDSVMLWVDQLCINQDDGNEKDRQVPLMSLIYQRALNTFIWLGPDSDKGAFAFLRRIQLALGNHTLDEQSDSLFEGFFEEESISDFNIQEAWDVLQDLFTRNWFMRTWIIQEAVLSDRSIVMSGHERANWDDLTKHALTATASGFYRWLSRQVGEGVGRIASGCTIAQDLGLLKSWLGDPRMLMTVLVDVRYAACSEARDKVYGGMGLSNAEIRPDYQKPIAEVYREASLIAVRQSPRPTEERGPSPRQFHGWFRLLACVDHDVDELQLPSWVPNWSKPRRTTALAWISSSLVAYNAGDWYHDSVFSFDDNERVLSTPGKVFGEVKKLTDTFSSPYLSNNPTDNIWLCDLLGFVTQCTPYPTGEDAEDILTQLCVAGKNESGLLKSPPEFRSQVRALLKAFQAPSPSRADPELAMQRQRQQTPKKHKKAKLPGERRRRDVQDLRLACQNALTNRRLCQLSNRYLGLVPEHVREGDTIVVFAGAGTPFVIRQAQYGNYILVGECYIHGIMQGEILKQGLPDTVVKLV